MKKLRLLLFPFAIVYEFITWSRNWLYDNGIFKSASFELPIIVVGNLSVGGTGKTPQIEYLIRLLSDKYQIAVLSRGYKRQSKGFILADETSTVLTLGDEPFQYFQKFKQIQVAVDANRVNGIQRLLELPKKPKIILMDDAFQHRKVKAGFYVLLTTYNDLYCNDYILPMGNLRESCIGAKRANLIIVTKCPKHISENEQLKIKMELNLNSNQSLYFSFIDYNDAATAEHQSISIHDLRAKNKTIVAGIAKPKPFIDYVKNDQDDVLIYADHHAFSNDDLLEIDKKSIDKIILTTEKDYVRLKHTFLKNKLFYLGIKTGFVANENQFKQEILDFVTS